MPRGWGRGWRGGPGAGRPGGGGGGGGGGSPGRGWGCGGGGGGRVGRGCGVGAGGGVRGCGCGAGVPWSGFAVDRDGHAVAGRISRLRYAYARVCPSVGAFRWLGSVRGSARRNRA